MDQQNQNQDDNTRTHTVMTKGTMVGHYRIIEKIGAGGMGEVYLANDTKLNRQVALKFLPSHLIPDLDAKARFTREAQAAASLKHPNIVTIYEVSEHNGRPFFAMECCEGQTLRDIIKEQNLSLEQVYDLTIQICEGLQEAHEAGIIHRDIKPSNIILDKQGRPKLVDFGLASIQGTDKLTKTGSTLGTIGYMSPEQIQVKNVDRRSDLFSLGVVLYELITGQLPFKADTEAATLNSVLNDIPEPLSRYKSGVPDDLQRIVSKLLEKDPQLRYQSAAGIISDLKLLRRDSGPVTVSPGKGSSSFKKLLVPVLMVIIIVLLFVLKPWKIEVQPTDEVMAAENRLAIMYFDNLTDPTDSLRLGEIVTNLLITDLSESKYVQVVSSQRLYDLLKQLGHEGEKKIDRGVATQIARKAKARWMLFGSILSTAPEIIVAAQLVDVESGNALASQRVKGQAGERIFSVVDQLTVEVKGDLSLPEEASVEVDHSVASVSTHSPEAYRLFIEGVELMDRHYWSEADEYFAKALEYDSTFALAHYRRAAMAYWYDDPVAKKHIEKALRYSEHSGDKSRHYIISLDARLKRDYARSIEELEYIIEHYPDEKGAYLALGLTNRFITGDIEDAVEYFEKLVELDPYHREGLNQLAYACNDLGQFEKSIWAINKYIEIAPDEANPYDSKAEILALNGKLDEAIAVYEKANELKPGFSNFRLAEIHLLCGEYTQAESLYTATVVDGDKEERSYGRLGLARILLHQGKFRDAIHTLDRGIETDRMELVNESIIAAKIWVQCVSKAYIGNIQQAIDDAEAEIKILEQRVPDDDWINYSRAHLAWRYMLLNDSTTAYGIINQLIPGSNRHYISDSIAYWFGRAYVSLAGKNFDTAVVYWDYLQKAWPVDYPNQLFLGISRLGAGQLGQAVSTLEKAMNTYGETRAIWPHLSVLGHYWLAQAYEASGWNDKAIEQYETFLDIWKNADPGIKAVEDARGRMERLRKQS